MVTLQQDTQVTSTVIDHWWQYIRHDHRLFLRLMNEKPEHLEKLPYMNIIITHIERNRTTLLQMSYPNTAKTVREHLLSAERYFLGCLRALQKGNLEDAELYHNMAHADLSMLQYIFMESGVKSHI